MVAWQATGHQTLTSPAVAQLVSGLGPFRGLGSHGFFLFQSFGVLEKILGVGCSCRDGIGIMLRTIHRGTVKGHQVPGSKPNCELARL